MKIEITPISWSRFGNVINTLEGPAIYCVELASFPETHMLTKFKSDYFSDFSNTIQNIGWKYEKVESWRRSGSVSRVETSDYIFYLSEDNRVQPSNTDNAPARHADPVFENCCESFFGSCEKQMDWSIIRSEYSDMYQYLNSKRIKPLHTNCWCGTCFWSGISIPPDYIPECTMCKNDTLKVSVKVNTGVKKTDIEPDCCKSCIWWEWFHNIRKNMVGCKCDDICDCGKLSYHKKRAIIINNYK